MASGFGTLIKGKISSVVDPNNASSTVQGPPGESGEAGEQGEQGPQGTAGTAGATGATGAAGAAGAQGVPGQDGIDGEDGWTPGLNSTPMAMVAFAAYQNTNQTGVVDSTNTKVRIDTEALDTHGYFDPTTNYRFTPGVAGWYRISAQVAYQSMADGKRCQLLFYFNGALNKSLTNIAAGATVALYVNATCLVKFNGTTDYLELYCWHTNGSDASLYGLVAGNEYTYFQGELVLPT